jgi:hypothetical protein
MKSAIIVNMNSHLDSQNFIGYRSVYEFYKFLMNWHLDPPRSDSDPLTALLIGDVVIARE